MKKKKIVFSIIAVSALISGGMSLASCRKTEDAPIVKDDVSVTGVALTSSVKYTNVGSTLSLITTVSPSDATDKTVSYVSSDESVLTVSNIGNITGIGVGSAKVTVTTKDGGFKSEIEIKVYAKGVEVFDADGLSNSLMSTPYSSNSITGSDKYGLEDANNVGVDESLKDIALYEVPEESTFNNVIDVSKITLAKIQEKIPEATVLNSYYQIQAALLFAESYSNGDNKTLIKLPEGKLDVDASLSTTSYAFIASNLKNTYIVGNNTTIEISVNKLLWSGYFKLDNASNVYVSGITFRSKVPANLSGKITKFDTTNRKIYLDVDSEFNDICSLISDGKKTLRSYLEFHPSTLAPIQDGNFVVDNFTDYVVSGNVTEGYKIVVTFKTNINESALGTLCTLQFAQYDAHGMTISNSENVYIDNITMNNASGMALTASSTKNLYINRFKLVKKAGSKALMTSCADAMHFSLLSGEVKVTNSIVEYSHDDALNIKHGYWYAVSEVVASSKTINLKKITSSMPAPVKGDKIAIYNESTFASCNPSTGYYTVDTCTTTSTGFEVTVNERMSGVATWGNCRATFISNNPTFTYKNNIVRYKRNRGILVQVPNAIIENNTFTYIGHGSIQAATALDVYNEATLPQNISIKNNKFINNNYLKGGTLTGDISVFAISNNASVAPQGTLTGVNIENNFIAKNGNACISLRGVSESAIKDNLFYNASRTQPSGDGFNCILRTENNKNIDVDGNYNQYNLDNGLSGVITAGTTAPEDVILSDNYNIGFQVIDDVGPEVTVSKATGAPNLDGSLSEWEGIGATNIDIVGITDAEGTQKTASQISDHFAINKLMMTYTNDAIYIGFDVFDNEATYKTKDDFWLGDCVEILASNILDKPNADLKVYKEEGGVMQAAFNPNWTSSNCATLAEVRTNSKYLTSSSKLEAKYTTSSTGYTGEIILDFNLFTDFKASIDAEKRIDMAIVIADAERIGTIKRVQASNVAHNVEGNKTKTARMPQYLFK